MADSKLQKRLFQELMDYPHSTLRELHSFVPLIIPGRISIRRRVSLDEVKAALDELVELGAVVLRGQTYQAKGGRGVWKRMAEENKPTADQIQFALDLAKEKGKDYTKSKLQGMSGKEVSDAIDSMKKEETKPSDKQVSFALDLLKEQGKSSPSKAQLEKMPAANISKLIDKLKGSDKKAQFITAANNVIVINDSHGGFGLSNDAKDMFEELTGKRYTDKVPRHHPTLVEVVKSLGSKGASGSTARLKLYRLSGGKYKIDEYDGMETPVEPSDIRWISTSKLAASNRTPGEFSSLDTDQEELAKELYMMASNDGRAYQKRDADGAVKTAMRELRQQRVRDLDYDMKAAHKAVVKALKARWRQSDKEHRQNQRAASVKKQAVQEAMKRAKTDPEFRRRLVAAVQKKAKPGGGPISKKDYDGFFKHLMAAYKMASKWESEDKPGGYVANESLGAFMEKLKRDMKKHVK